MSWLVKHFLRYNEVNLGTKVPENIQNVTCIYFTKIYNARLNMLSMIAHVWYRYGVGADVVGGQRKKYLSVLVTTNQLVWRHRHLTIDELRVKVLQNQP